MWWARSTLLVSMLFLGMVGGFTAANVNPSSNLVTRGMGLIHSSTGTKSE